MCCASTCHPGTLELSLSLPVAATSSPDPAWQPVFAQERSRYAHPSDAWSAEAAEKDMNVTLTLRPVSDRARPLPSSGPPPVILFFTEDGWINSDQDQRIEVGQDGSLTLRLVRAEVFLGKKTPDRLLGVVQWEGGWHRDGSLRSMMIRPLLRR
jgi:hypothetical protein